MYPGDLSHPWLSSTESSQVPGRPQTLQSPTMFVAQFLSLQCSVLGHTAPTCWWLVRSQMDFKSQSLSIAIGVLKDGGITDIACGSQNPERQTRCPELPLVFIEQWWIRDGFQGLALVSAGRRANSADANGATPFGHAPVYGSF